jgi:hypothetical protein
MWTFVLDRCTRLGGPFATMASPPVTGRRVTQARFGLSTVLLIGSRLRDQVLLIVANLLDLVVHPHRTLSERHRKLMSIEHFRRMSPEDLAKWHRQTGIEARVLAALAEADRDVGEVDPEERVPVLHGAVERQRASTTTDS